MHAIIHPGSISGIITAPPSKSVMQRICAAIWVKGGGITIRNPGQSADDNVLLALLRQAGCSIAIDSDGSIAVDAVPANQHTMDMAHFGESGLAARMCTPILALAGREVLLTGDESLQGRPMDFFKKVLPQFSVDIDAEGLPATIRGKLTPANIEVDGSVSSQFLTGLLMAYAGANARDVTISVSNLVSKPYIDLTLQVMEVMGLPVPINSDYRSFYFPAGASPSTAPREIDIEGDWSSAAFLLVGGAIAGRITIKGLVGFSAQGDKKILSALMDSGASLSIESDQITIAPAALRAFQFDATDCPDLFPPLAVLACFASGTSVIEGVHRLEYKESNRAKVIIEELTRMGADIVLQDDLMVIKGSTRLKGATLASHNDHRIAMMCSIAALAADGASVIHDAGAVSKSYPHFFDDLGSLGALVALGE